MGFGEYGGNGSVHYYAALKKDRNHGNGHPHNYHEIDEFPSTPGSNFTVRVLGLRAGQQFTADADGVVTVETPISIDPADPNKYTPSVFVLWPDPPSGS